MTQLGISDMGTGVNLEGLNVVTLTLFERQNNQYLILLYYKLYFSIKNVSNGREILKFAIVLRMFALFALVY